MWADVQTKPLQGPKFRVMRAFLMNCPVDCSKESPFNPSPPPPTSLSTPLPMKPQITKIAPAPQGGCWDKLPWYKSIRL